MKTCTRDHTASFLFTFLALLLFALANPSVSRGAPPKLDLNGDGFADLLFQNIFSGQLEQWQLDGTGASVDFGTGGGVISAGPLYAGRLVGWILVGTGDVDGDGIDDLVFQNIATGQVYAWFQDGTGDAVNFDTGAGITGAGFLYSGLLAVGWRLAGVGDLDGDGIADLVFQNNDSGELVAWFLDGTGTPVDFGTGGGINAFRFLYDGSLADWRLVAVGDINGDGFSDLVFQNILLGTLERSTFTGNLDRLFLTGQVYAWFLDGTGGTVNFATGSGIQSAGYLYAGVLSGWLLTGMSDVNGDGFTDLLYQNVFTGQVYAWFLNGTGATVNFATGSGFVSTGYLYGGSLFGWLLR